MSNNKKEKKPISIRYFWSIKHTHIAQTFACACMYGGVEFRTLFFSEKYHRIQTVMQAHWICHPTNVQQQQTQIRRDKSRVVKTFVLTREKRLGVNVRCKYACVSLCNKVLKVELQSHIVHNSCFFHLQSVILIQCWHTIYINKLFAPLFPRNIPHLSWNDFDEILIRILCVYFESVVQKL